MHKIRLEAAHQTLTFGGMQLFDTMQPGGPTTTSTTTYFSPQHLEIFLLPLQSQTSYQSFWHKNTYESVSVLDKWPIKVLKPSLSVGGFGYMGPLFRFFEAFGVLLYV